MSYISIMSWPRDRTANFEAHLAPCLLRFGDEESFDVKTALLRSRYPSHLLSCLVRERESIDCKTSDEYGFDSILAYVFTHQPS